MPPSNMLKYKYLQEVVVPVGKVLQRSRVKPVSEWGRQRGGLEQFELLEQAKDARMQTSWIKDDPIKLFKE
jgi:hypothetical protein